MVKQVCFLAYFAKHFVLLGVDIVVPFLGIKSSSEANTRLSLSDIPGPRPQTPDLTKPEVYHDLSLLAGLFPYNFQMKVFCVNKHQAQSLCVICIFRSFCVITIYAPK